MIESEFEYNGYKCFTTFNDFGFRCGYVMIPKDNPLYGRDIEQSIGITPEDCEKYLELKCRFTGSEYLTLGQYFSVHGGVTLTDIDYITGSDNWLIGFDCNHLPDNVDEEMLLKYFGIKKERRPFGEVRTLEYVQENCKSLVSQIQSYLKIVEKKNQKS